MTLVIRERRRHQQPLTLTIPPHDHLNRIVDSSSCSPLSSSSTGLSSPGLPDFKKLSVLGWGNGGTVYKVSHVATGDIYALKVVRSSVEAVHEVEIVQRVNSSEFVVRCIGVLDGGSSDVVCFVMEYMDAGSLQSMLCREKMLPEESISRIVASVLRGLQHLHRLRVVHGDIKPSNILLNAKGEVKIADFGASRIIDRESNIMSTCSNTGTCAYMSPERIDPDGYCDECWEGYAGDVWSVGVVAMECYIGRFPLVPIGEKLNWVTLMLAICSGENAAGSVVRMGSPELRSFCERCLEREWRKRATVEELLRHPFVNKSREFDRCTNGLDCVEDSS